MRKPGWEPRQCDDRAQTPNEAVPAHIRQTWSSPEISNLYSPEFSSQQFLTSLPLFPCRLGLKQDSQLLTRELKKKTKQYFQCSGIEFIELCFLLSSLRMLNFEILWFISQPVQLSQICSMSKSPVVVQEADSPASFLEGQQGETLFSFLFSC